MRAGKRVRAALEGSIWSGCADASTRTHVSNINPPPQQIHTTTPANV